MTITADKVVAGVVIYALFASLTAYLDLPIVGINQGGKCAYIETHGTRDYTCDIIPNKYITEHVQ